MTLLPPLLSLDKFEQAQLQQSRQINSYCKQLTWTADPQKPKPFGVRVLDKQQVGLTWADSTIMPHPSCT